MASDLERVVVVGTSCSGKTTFARALAQTFSAHCFDLDPLFWGPNWTPRPIEEFCRATAEQAAAERWVASGNYRDVRDMLWPRATAVVWLNSSLPVVLVRALRRTFLRNLTREELWHGNRESLRRTFLSRESILFWVVTSHHRGVREFRALRAQRAFPHLAWVEFRRPVEATQYLRSMQNARWSGFQGQK